ncbi:MAG: hypothetical protein AAF623_18965 [Planctomycetota bacterium]
MLSKNEPVTITIRTTNGYEYPFESDRKVQEAAYRWTSVLKKRRRWQNDENYRQSLIDSSYQELLNFLGPENLREIADQNLVEISIRLPEIKESESGKKSRLDSNSSLLGNHEAHILPWEFLIAEGTRKAGRRDSITVVRHLDCDFPRRNIEGELKSLLMVTGSPGRVNEYYDFESEQKLVQQSAFGELANIQDKDDNFHLLKNPDIELVRKKIQKLTPQIIHLAGVDNHQGWSDFQIGERGTKSWDGMILKSQQDWGGCQVTAQELATVLNCGDQQPALVFANLQNSAARTAYLAVAHGANSALGFQDYIKDGLAETFFSDFYDAFRESGTDNHPWCAHTAFMAAFRLLKQAGYKLKGSGIVLWTAKSILEIGGDWNSFFDGVDDVVSKINQKNRTVVSPTEDTAINELLEVDIQIKDRLNYSLMHNQWPIFDKFEIRKGRGKVKSVQVEVEVHVGAERPRFTKLLNLDRKITRLENEIFFPLTWMRTELFWETVMISAYVRVTWGEQVIFSESLAMMMDPPDYWIDTDENRQSLPSLVFPRDPAVNEIIRSAQEVLAGVSDDYLAGFDGYQSIDPENEDDPYAGVDYQVQAIWTALVRNFKLSYINPPPTFTDYAQRIRTPEEVIRGGRGTCIDLTILLASCLEYIEIYPVIFLMHGHAFPGYWRSAEEHEKFVVPTDFVTEEPSTVNWQKSPWTAEAYEEVLQQIHDGNIVPLESVWLTKNGGFWESIQEGWANMRIANEFHSLIDIQFARNNNVTPLPIRGLRD